MRDRLFLWPWGGMRQSCPFKDGYPIEKAFHPVNHDDDAPIDALRADGCSRTGPSSISDSARLGLPGDRFPKFHWNLFWRSPLPTETAAKSISPACLGRNAGVPTATSWNASTHPPATQPGAGLRHSLLCWPPAVGTWARAGVGQARGGAVLAGHHRRSAHFRRPHTARVIRLFRRVLRAGSGFLWEDTADRQSQAQMGRHQCGSRLCRRVLENTALLRCLQNAAITGPAIKPAARLRCMRRL